MRMRIVIQQWMESDLSSKVAGKTMEKMILPSILGSTLKPSIYQLTHPKVAKNIRLSFKLASETLWATSVQAEPKGTRWDGLTVPTGALKYLWVVLKTPTDGGMGCDWPTSVGSAWKHSKFTQKKDEFDLPIAARPTSRTCNHIFMSFCCESSWVDFIIPSSWRGSLP